LAKKKSQDHVVTGISLPIDLLALIDKERGDVNRSRFIEKLIEQEIDNFTVIDGKIVEKQKQGTQKS